MPPKCGKSVGNIFIALLYIVIASVYYVFVALLFNPYENPTTPDWVVLIMFHTLLFLQQWCLIAAIISDPGQVPKYWGFRMGDSEAKRRRYCLMCHTFKPERCHHCSACAKCVINMDHHCPWINNCIGFNNRKIFLLLLCYTLFLAYFVLAFLFPPVYATISELVHSYRDSTIQPKMYPGFVYVCTFVFLGLLCFAMTVFTKFHLHLVLINSTTIESLDKATQYSRYSLGLYENWVQVFGKDVMMWPLPFYGRSGRPMGDGVVWNVNSKEDVADNIMTNRDSLTERGAYPNPIPPPVRLACSGVIDTKAREENSADQSGIMLNQSQLKGLFSDPDSESSFMQLTKARLDMGLTDQSFLEIEERSEVESAIVSPQTVVAGEAEPHLPSGPRGHRSVNWG
mmetsp:Transcript_29998/g.53214  ORF Transcript_29998/g.53214 Transcript_29998/m.53214 type:complete len:398 (-) Transcript_29998:2-1195(-)